MATASSLLDYLSGGDRRSIGHANMVAAWVQAERSLLPNLVEGLASENRLVRMRAADACEKVSACHPEWFQPFVSELLDTGRKTSEQELKWHLLQILPRLRLTGRQHMVTVNLAKRLLRDPSRIVQTAALQALADLSEEDETLRNTLPDLFSQLSVNGTPAVRARARKLNRIFGKRPSARIPA